MTGDRSPMHGVILGVPMGVLLWIALLKFLGVL